MLFGRYRITSRFQNKAQLPPFKGSTFRGAFGAALKKVVCAVRNSDCGTCLLAGRCLYARTFETRLPDPARPARMAAPPHPYVIEPPLGDRTHFCQEAPFDFSLLLFGEANDYLPYFVYAFQVMGEAGIGRRIDGRRGRFSLTGVFQDQTPLYDPQDNRLDPANPCRLDLPTPGGSQQGELTVRLLTPLRLKFENRYQAELPFHLLVRAMLRRVSSLMDCYGDGEPELDYRGLVARAAEVEMAGSSLRWSDWQRYSNRQEQAMLMGGMTGSATYRGRLGEFLPLLEFCREVHLGKQTSFGLGQIDFDWREGA